MHPLSGPYLIGMAVLALGGLLKLVRPDDTVNAMRAVGLPATRTVARLLGVWESGVAAGAIVAAGPLFPVLAGVSYAGFAAFVLAALRRGTAVQSCGCFGKVETPPSLAHLVVNVGAAGTSFAYAATSNRSLVGEIVTSPGEALPLLALSAVGVYLVYVALTALPETLGQLGAGR